MVTPVSSAIAATAIIYFIFRYGLPPQSINVWLANCDDVPGPGNWLWFPKRPLQRLGTIARNKPLCNWVICAALTQNLAFNNSSKLSKTPLSRDLSCNGVSVFSSLAVTLIEIILNCQSPHRFYFDKSTCPVYCDGSNDISSTDSWHVKWLLLNLWLMNLFRFAIDVLMLQELSFASMFYYGTISTQSLLFNCKAILLFARNFFAVNSSVRQNYNELLLKAWKVMPSRKRSISISMSCSSGPFKIN